MTTILTRHEIADLLDRAALIDAVEQAHAHLATGRAHNPAPSSMPIGDGGVAIPMVSQSDSAGLVVVKTMSDLPGNPARGLPRQRSAIIVFSAATGECVAVLDGRTLTAARTAAASAVATRHLAPPGPTVLGLIGAGNLAVEHARAIALVREVSEVRVWSRSASTVDRFRGEIQTLGVPVVEMSSPRDVVDTSDVVCTLTPSKEPIVLGDWLHPGMHLNVVGAAPRPDEREVDGRALARSVVVVDHTPTALTKSGDAHLAIAEGAIGPDRLATELGDVVTGRHPGRLDPREITLYNSTGIGLQDLAATALVLSAARTGRVGTHIDLTA
ncbi:ornithine cyclodeaminase family protein [Tsukamurella soli]|uniref:Alanine dehydrogenase n=1 Tax=Tsukamurella soli TaxID=644556 RepID=A0ABP8JN23_9ACTN